MKRRTFCSFPLASGLSSLTQPSSNGFPIIEPSWESMAQNYRCPAWFQDGKIGIWMHWGINSAVDPNRPPDGGHYGRRMYGTQDYLGRSEADFKATEVLAEWHAKRYGPPDKFGYEKLIPLFTAAKWNPDALVQFFKQCGARFIMPVAVHHDNFDMYDSSFPWNSVSVGPRRDVLGEWKQAARKHGLKFGVSTHLYWSPAFFNTARRFQKPGTKEWLLFNMDYDPHGYASQDSWNEFWYRRCWELIEKYDPDMFNNDAPFPDERTGKGLGVKLFSAFLNRNRAEHSGRQEAVLSHKSTNIDRRAFTYNLERGMLEQLQPYPWIWATDLSGNWFYRAGSFTRMSLPVLIGNALDVISKNGVVMMNVALRGDGTLPENQAAMLREFGNWVRVNAEGIYGTRPWKVFGEGPAEISGKRIGENLKPFSPADVRFTTNGRRLYAFVLAEPRGDIMIKTLASSGELKDDIESIAVLGTNETVHWTRSAEGLLIRCPKAPPPKYAIGLRILCKSTVGRRYAH